MSRIRIPKHEKVRAPQRWKLWNRRHSAAGNASSLRCRIALDQGTALPRSSGAAPKHTCKVVGYFCHLHNNDEGPAWSVPGAICSTCVWACRTGDPCSEKKNGALVLTQPFRHHCSILFLRWSCSRCFCPAREPPFNRLPPIVTATSSTLPLTATSRCSTLFALGPVATQQLDEKWTA